MGDLFTPGHIILVAIVALLLFGPKKLPELGRAFGKTLKEFKEGVKGAVSDDEPVNEVKEVREVKEVKEVKELPVNEDKKSRNLPD